MFDRTRSVAGIALFCVLSGLTACDGRPKQAQALGAAYVGPHLLKLRGDIPLDAPVVATLKHGDRVEILQRRRRFLRVRTAGGAIGWTDERQLLAEADMAALRQLSESARNLPSQGQASTFRELNVHTQASRQSPSFAQLKEGDKADVLLHRYLPRKEFPRTPLLPPPAKKAKVAKKPPKEPKYPPPPMPKPPGAPADWLELSKTELEDEDPAEAEPPAPVPHDNWTLIRMANGATGWVLTSRLYMAIPDEVAQYAEGRRIVSYFPLAEVFDDGEKRRHWLWTTAGSATTTHDFDSFRVFVWNSRRDRYETAYIERNIKGFAPVIVNQVEWRGGATGATEKVPGFSICMEKRDGQRYRREYAFLTNIVRSVGERPCEAPPAETQKAPSTAPLPGAGTAESGASESLSDRIKQRVRRLFGK